jgi:hypothetical protein
MLYQVVTPIIQPRMRFFDADGKPLVGGKVYSCYVGTNTFKPTYRDANKTALNTNPIVLDADGSALIYLNGAHVLKVYDRDGNLIESRYMPESQMRTQFFDKYGVPLKNGKVWTYDIASTIKKTSYANADKTQPNANPVVLDAEGWASISMLGSYRLRSYNEKGVSTGDQDFRRPVAKALTSKTYPLYFMDGVGVSIVMTGGSLKTTLNNYSIIENISTQLSVVNAIIKETLNSTTLPAESLQTSFSVTKASCRETLNKTTLAPENILGSFTVTGVRLSKGLVSSTMQPENVQTSFVMVGAQFTN